MVFSLPLRLLKLSFDDEENSFFTHCTCDCKLNLDSREIKLFDRKTVVVVVVVVVPSLFKAFIFRNLLSL